MGNNDHRRAKLLVEHPERIKHVLAGLAVQIAGRLVC